jgi:ABC-type multidrug transport system ATPase subunit
MTHKLEFDSLYLEFGLHRVLSSVYMYCCTGQVVGLLGRNGSGKSCLMKVVIGAMEAESKSVRLNNIPLLNGNQHGSIISYLPQSDLLPPFLSFRKALALNDIDYIKIIQEFPEIEILLNRKSSEVSGGERRLLEVLLILFSNHPFCILDEPFSGLMPIQIEKLKEAIINQKKNKGIMITDHLHRHVREVADDLYILTNGKTYKISHEDQLLQYGYLNEL